MGGETNYQISTSMNEGIIEIIITGEVTEHTVHRLHTEVITIICGKNVKAVLTDVSALKGYNDTFAEVYFRARNIPPEVRKLPSAVVDQSMDAAYRSFYETTSANVGHKLKWFPDIEAARTWLKSMI